MSLSLKHGEQKYNNKEWKFYGISSSVGYKRFFAGMNFSAYYRYILRDDEQRGEMTEHNFELNFLTRKIRIGTLYATYAFLYIDETDKYLSLGAEDFFDDEYILETTAKTKTHTIRTGIRGRIPGRELGRAYWNIEGTYYNSKTDGKRPSRFSDSELNGFFTEQTIEKYSRERSYYSLVGDLSYPFRRGILVTFRAGYLSGKTDGDSLKKFFYEARLNYPIFRNFDLLAWWRETKYEYDTVPNRKEQELEVVARYRRGKMFFSFEGRLRRVEDDPSIEREDRRIYLKVKRII
jgi:hypothetical protein